MWFSSLKNLLLLKSCSSDFGQYSTLSWKYYFLYRLLCYDLCSVNLSSILLLLLSRRTAFHIESIFYAAESGCSVAVNATVVSCALAPVWAAFLAAAGCVPGAPTRWRRTSWCFYQRPTEEKVTSPVPEMSYLILQSGKCRSLAHPSVRYSSEDRVDVITQLPVFEWASLNLSFQTDLSCRVLSSASKAQWETWVVTLYRKCSGNFDIIVGLRQSRCGLLLKAIVHLFCDYTGCCCEGSRSSWLQVSSYTSDSHL